jgi:hypothetical protein
MSDIQRYLMLLPTTWQESASGPWVLYADHVAAVQAARAEERQRINSMLVVDYVREQYERGAADKAAELQDYYGEQAQGHYADGYNAGLIEGDKGGRKEGYRIGYNAAWSLSAAEIEHATELRVREEEQVAQTLARAELYSMDEMDIRCEEARAQGQRDALTAAVERLRSQAALGGRVDPDYGDFVIGIDDAEAAITEGAVLAAIDGPPDD